MKITIRNKTNSKAQVNFSDGSGEVVKPGHSVIVEINDIFHEEFERMKSFFGIEIPEAKLPKRIMKKKEV